MFNENSLTTLALNSGHGHRQVQDETIFEQLFHIDNYREEIPLNSTANTSHMSSQTMPILSIANTISNRPRSVFVQQSNTIQLPLIGTHQPRPVLRTPMTKAIQDPLEALPYRRRRNPMHYVMPLNAEEAKRNLRDLAERGSTPPTVTRPTARRSVSSLQTRPFTPEESLPLPPKPSTPQPVPSETPTRFFEVHRLIIHKGFLQDQTEHYRHFRHTYNATWSSLVKILHRLEKLMYEHTVPMAIIDGERVVQLDETIGSERRATVEELLSTVLNRTDIDRWIKLTEKSNGSNSQRSVSHLDQVKAAIRIQAFWRAIPARRRYAQVRRRRQWAIRVITSVCFRYIKLKQFRLHLKTVRQRQLEFFQQKQNELRENWTYISANRRVIVHLPSLGLTQTVREHVQQISLMENYQIGRVCDLSDPNIDVIYVSPMLISEEISQYYHKLISLRPMVEQGTEQVSPATATQIDERFNIVIPEALESFPAHPMCLSTLLKYSPKALKQIKALINNRMAYMISSISHMDDLAIAEYLNIPIFGCEPELSYLYSTKSGAKRIFQTSQIPMPFGEYDIYNEKHLLESLTQLILDNLNIQRWLFKIDDFIDGLGIAYCDVVSHLSCYSGVLKEALNYAEQWSNKSVQRDCFDRIISELPHILSEHTAYVKKELFSDWSSYLKVFLSHGGIIEAYPSSNSITSVTVCLSIEPDGHHSIICSANQLHIESKFSSWALLCPQSSIDPVKLNQSCSAIAEQCQQRNIFGFIDVDFVVFLDYKTNEELVWVVDLSIGYSEHVSLFRVMQYVTTGLFHGPTHNFAIRNKEIKRRLRNWQNGAPEQQINEQKCFSVWTSRLHHSQFAQMSYSEFFQFCRAHGIGYDIRKKQGTIFTLLQAKEHEHLGLMTISDTSENARKNFLLNLKEIQQELTRKTSEERTNFQLAIDQMEKNHR